MTCPTAACILVKTKGKRNWLSRPRPSWTATLLLRLRLRHRKTANCHLLKVPTIFYQLPTKQAQMQMSKMTNRRPVANTSFLPRSCSSRSPLMMITWGRIAVSNSKWAAALPRWRLSHPILRRLRQAQSNLRHHAVVVSTQQKQKGSSTYSSPLPTRSCHLK